MTDGGFFVGRLMFFIVSKTFGLMTVPSTLIVMMGLAGIALLFTRWARTGQRLLAASVLLVAAIGVLPIGTALIVPLEERFPPWDPERGTPTGVIVLGGVIGPERSIVRGQISLDDAAERVTAAVELARKYPNLRLVFAGGNASVFEDLLKPTLPHCSSKVSACHEIGLQWKLSRAIPQKMRSSVSV